MNKAIFRICNFTLVYAVLVFAAVIATGYSMTSAMGPIIF